MNTDVFASARAAINPAIIEKTAFSIDNAAQRVNGEWIVKCPFHADTNPSFNINATTGMYHCFGCGAEGDHIILYEKLKGISRLDAAKYIIELAGNGHADTATTPEPKKEKPKPVIPIPTEELPKFKNHARNKYITDKYGDPVKAWQYDKDGQPWQIVVRFEKLGKKNIVPFYFGTDRKFHAGSPIKKNRSIFNIDKVNGQPILIVEGEGCASVEVPGYTLITWSGGAQSTHLTDWKPLKDHDVLIWPDADKPGLDAALYISEQLPQAEILDIQGRTTGWDIVEATKENINPVEFIKICPRLNFNKTKCDITPTEFLSLTDLGNTERFMKLYGDKVVYIPEEADFYFYNNKRWERDLQGAKTRHYIELSIRNIYAEAEKVDDFKQRKATADWAQKSEGKQRREAVFGDLKSKVVKSIKSFDQNQWLFNVNNGTIDLQTGKLQPHDPNDFMMKISPVDFDPEAECPLWLSTLELFFQRQKEIIEYVQKLFGYTMAGVKNERLIVFFFGKGRNGKSTITGNPLKVFGDYGLSADISTFIKSKWGRQPGSASEDVARLINARYVRATEIGNKDKLNEKFIKDISGGDIITARNLHARSFDFMPTFTLWMFGNEKIQIEGTDTGIKDRVKFIPLTYQIPGTQEDKKMRDYIFEAEASGILNWLIRGCLKWQQEGLKEPTAIKKATEDFFEEQDYIALFLKDCCEMGDMESTQYSVLYAAFCEYSDKPYNKQRFSKELTDKGYDIIAATGNVRYVSGVKLLEEKTVKKGEKRESD